MQDFVWAEKYRPKTVSETILPESIKSTFQSYVDQGNIPNLLLAGGSGIGKTTIARAAVEELGADCLEINASKDGNIDTLRVQIQNFASSVSFTSNRKVVLLDEADYLNANSTQPALRNFMESYSSNCAFILTCNLKDRIIEPLQSRCGFVSFRIPKSERADLSRQFFKRVRHILDSEGVDYDQRVVAEVIKLHFPDWRRVVNELQRYSSVGRIDDGILISHSSDNLNGLIKNMKDKKFSEIRKWVTENSDLDSEFLYRRLYDELPPLLSNESSVATAIMILAEYQYKEAFVANSAINRSACFANLMAELDWK